MRIISYHHDGQPGFGRVENDRVAQLNHPEMPDLRSALVGGFHLADLPAQAILSLSTVKLLPVLPNPAKIFCVGHNYEDHRIETGRDRVGHPSIFTRFADTLVADGAPVVCPAVSTMLDYEGELAVIIGTGGRAIAVESAMDHVAGLSCANDVSVRDWQRHTQQFTPGKNFPDTCPLGPAMVSLDALAKLGDLALTTRVNDEVVQHAVIDQMIFPIPVIIAYISSFTPLRPGDVILTGTPGGVGARREPPRWLVAGDCVSVTIDGVGLLSNPVVAEAA